jgi:hypothetical protein
MVIDVAQFLQMHTHTHTPNNRHILLTHKNTNKFYIARSSKINDSGKWVQQIYWRCHDVSPNAEINTEIFLK